MATVLEPTIDHGPPPESSDRNFGFVFAAVFTLIGCWPLWHFESPRWWALIIAAAFTLLALIRPQVLRHLNRAWLALGKLMHRVVSPIVMGGVFFLCVTPTAYIMRIRGKDLLSLKRRPDLNSYLIDRKPALSDLESMKLQY
jgi:predicted membrane metal-binding protein